MHSDCEIDADFDPLFGDVPIGVPADGVLITDLGWAGLWLFEAKGIESIVALGGFNEPEEFHRWMQAASRSSLNDWYGVKLRLYECWYLEPIDGTFCYASWCDNPDKNSLFSRPIDVFCLRHVNWDTNKSRRAINCARTQSYCIAAHLKLHPDVPVTPQIMNSSSSDGFMLTGTRANEDSETVLDWPTHNIEHAFSSASKFRLEGVREVHIWQSGIGISLDDLSDSVIARMLAIDHYYEGDIALADLLGYCGMK